MMRQGYVAGKYSGTPGEVQANVRAAASAALYLAGLGFHPICPHMMFDHRKTSWDQAMTRCRAILHSLDPQLDIVVLLPGWEESPGAVEERNLAYLLGLPIVAMKDVLGFSA